MKWFVIAVMLATVPACIAQEEEQSPEEQLLEAMNEAEEEFDNWYDEFEAECEQDAKDVCKVTNECLVGFGMAIENVTGTTCEEAMLRSMTEYTQWDVNACLRNITDWYSMWYDEETPQERCESVEFILYGETGEEGDDGCWEDAIE